MQTKPSDIAVHSRYCFISTAPKCARTEQIGTKVSVNPDIWNPEKGLANGRSANAVTVNRAIDELTEEITGHYNRIKNSLGFITAELVKNAVMGVGLKPLTLPGT